MAFSVPKRNKKLVVWRKEEEEGEEGKQDRITVKDPRPPWRFLYLRETKSWWCGEGEEEEGEKVSLLTHSTARGMGKNMSEEELEENEEDHQLGFFSWIIGKF